VEPRYDQQLLDQEKMSNRFAQVLSPDPEDDGVWIHQQAWFSMGRFEKGVEGRYHPKIKGNGIYLFVLEGEGSVQDIQLSSKDGLGILDAEELTISALEDLYVLLMEVPMDRTP
jgi:redox-sensitive bicupin YhaK (pirin superfamily)